MPLYFYVLGHKTFHEQLRPALAASWRLKSFAPCRALCADLEGAIRAFQQTYHVAADDLLSTQIADGLPFDRRYWRLLVGELLMIAAVEIPEIESAAETLSVLIDGSPPPAEALARQGFRPIAQAHFGSRDLLFGGGYYRPDQAGWNDTPDVLRLANYLAAIDPDRWNRADLAPLSGLVSEDDRAEELDYAREWFPAFVDLYRRAAEQSRIIVCERL